MTALFANPSLVGLLLQAVGVLMIAVLCLTLLRTIGRKPLAPWTAAWLALFVALMTLLFAFQVPSFSIVLHPVYMFFEYTFGYLVFAGCREFATGRRLKPSDWWMAAVLLIPAIVLPVASRWQFNIFFGFHTLIYGYLFLHSWIQLQRSKPTGRTAPGVSVLKVALVLLAIAYISYGPIFMLAARGIISHDPAFLAYSSFYDLLLLTMLGFGMVMVATGEVQADLEIARDRLAGVAHTDHLTSAFNRYAFHTLLDRDLSGIAVIADIDNLKSINDQYGHSAGDAAIRAVAAAIRGCIRADDLLFRWGGDEFLVLLLGFTEADARARLAIVNDQLHAVSLPGGVVAVSVSVSMGFASFDSAKSLDEVIRVADTAMYGTKRDAAKQANFF
jgi:diguanylate cyclase (GGDEF)-like protein